MVKAVNIEYMTDGVPAEELGLPEEMEIPGDVDEDSIFDYISDKTGYLIESCCLEGLAERACLTPEIMAEAAGKSYLYAYCLEEAEYRLNNAATLDQPVTLDMIKALAKDMWDDSESWIGGDILDDKAKEFIEEYQPCDMEAKVACVEKLYEQTPAGMIADADTILADIMDEADFEVSGLAISLLGRWKTSNDRDAVEDVFETLTGIGFEEFLDMCINQTTKENRTECDRTNEVVTCVKKALERMGTEDILVTTNDAGLIVVNEKSSNTPFVAPGANKDQVDTVRLSRELQKLGVEFIV